ncbi:hypothetical protein VPH35_107692 [Triticum aestivum]|uniref:Uncharacterized protein n=1 Tax=Triticum turgidum subsp. durum TaxID=4567 RepID=A0A9R1B5R7_TRITD|nr:unnamed protein product [Triticum turgidum subsp. durum]
MVVAAAAVDRSAMGLDLEFRLLHGVGFQIRATMGWTWCSISMASSASARPSASFCCSSSASADAAGRGLLGPFGLLVLVDDGLSEQTAVYFYLVKGADGKLSTHFCQDAFRSLKVNILVKAVYGSFVPVLDGENLHAPMLPSVWAPDARQAVDALDLKAGRATPAAPAPAMLNFAPGQLPQVAAAVMEDQKRHGDAHHRFS